MTRQIESLLLFFILSHQIDQIDAFRVFSEFVAGRNLKVSSIRSIGKRQRISQQIAEQKDQN